MVDINIIPDYGSPQNRYLGAKAKGRPQRTPTQGPDTAPVTLIEYGDYECPLGKVIELGLGNKSAMGNILFFDERRTLFL